MSRSYRKTPSMNVVKPDGRMKAKFNRAFRRNQPLDFPSGNAYRKAYDSYRIRDCRLVGPSYASFRKAQIANGEYVDEKTCRRLYYRWYKRK